MYSATSAVVHYVTSGIDAPPLNDDNANSIPDYVEFVGEAADLATNYYRERGFRTIVPDRAGPDARPDIYISRFTPGVFGVTFPGPLASGGTFVVVSNNMDISNEESFDSLYGTVSHELFHDIQSAYFADNDPMLPPWVLEGSAAAMEDRVNPDLLDIVATIQLRNWFVATDQPITEQSYGSQLLWDYLDRLNKQILPAYLDSMGTHPIEEDAQAATRLAAVVKQRTHTSLAVLYQKFAVSIYDDYSDQLLVTRKLTLGKPSSLVGKVAPLAIHYVKLSVTKHAGTLTVKLALRPKLSAQFVYLTQEYAGLALTEHLLQPTLANDGRLRYHLPARIATNRSFVQAALVITNGAANSTAGYTLTTGK
jgi:hypothetical protein